jgi:hypothetical protein
VEEGAAEHRLRDVRPVAEPLRPAAPRRSADPETARSSGTCRSRARPSICSAMLEEKTKGNLTGDEERLLTQVLFDLRMRYVEQNEVRACREEVSHDPGDGPRGSLRAGALRALGRGLPRAGCKRLTGGAGAGRELPSGRRARSCAVAPRSDASVATPLGRRRRPPGCPGQTPRLMLRADGARRRSERRLHQHGRTTEEVSPVLRTGAVRRSREGPGHGLRRRQGRHHPHEQPRRRGGARRSR